MKFTLCIIALAIIVSVEASPAPFDDNGDIEVPRTGPTYFDNALESVQGAIMDTIRAGKDLQDMEGALQDIVSSSSFFFRTESATEYATAKNAYKNGWKEELENDDGDDDDKAQAIFGQKCSKAIDMDCELRKGLKEACAASCKELCGDCVWPPV